VAGCSDSASNYTPASDEGGLAKADSSAPSRDVTELSAAEAVEQVGLTDEDLLPGDTVIAPAGSDEVGGQVTLDGCGYDYTTESMRISRRQVWMDRIDQQVSYSNEVVVYETPAAARLALSQYKDATLNCPPDIYMKSAVAGVPALRSQLLDSELNSSSLPVTPSIATYQRLSTKAGDEMYATFIFQQRGSVLDAHYMLTLTPPAKSLRAELTRQAEATGGRLAELPPVSGSGTSS